MISIVICTRNRDIKETLKQNIAETVGCDYELVVIDNRDNRYSIFEAYNEGIRRAKGEILCFMHDDVLFQSIGWGNVIINHFNEDERIGLIGFAGTHFLPNTPMYWYSSPFVSQRNLNNDHGAVAEHYHEEWFGAEDIIEAVAVDGFCMFARKDMFERIAFDDKTYKGFHLYDMDICMQAIAAGYKVCICRDVLAEHSWSEAEQFSKKGADAFTVNLTLFANKWQKCLPIHKGLTLPEELFERINALYAKDYSSNNIRQSKAYRLGRLLLTPAKQLKSIFSPK